LLLVLSLTFLASHERSRAADFDPDNRDVPCPELFGCNSWCRQTDCGCVAPAGYHLCGQPSCSCTAQGDIRTCVFCPS
jgi:hypothetical protein